VAFTLTRRPAPPSSSGRRLRRHPARSLLCLVVAVASLVVPALGIMGPAEALRAGGVGPSNPLMRGFPAYYTDDAGHALRLCLNGRPKCDLTGRRDLRPPEGEAFYWMASTTLRAPGINVDIEFALEAAFAGQRPMVFDRLRIRGHVSQAGTYTINHPFGTTTVRAITPDEQRNVNFTRDIGCAPGPRGRCSFASAAQGRITTFLKQVGAPRGYFGNPARSRPLAGGQTVSISGPAGSDTSSRFAVLGQRAKARSVAIQKAVKFGNVDHAVTRRIKMLNIGLERIRVRKVRLLSGGRAFSRVQSPRACSGGDVLRVGGKSCTVGIRYTPTPGLSKAQLRIRSTLGKVRIVSLRGS
jgi:hypothetical protein